MRSVKLANNAFWVGVKDPDLRVFDINVKTEYGTTYNSYLIVGEKTALIDAVKLGFEEDFLAKIQEHLPTRQLDYLIVNHTEPDHSGAISALRASNPDIRFYCSKPAVPFLKNILNDDTADITGVKTGDRLELGGATLEFIGAPYLHWPDTMLTYFVEEKILFPCDAFAAHFCPHDGIFYKPGDKLVDQEVWRYYDAIMRPYSSHCRKAAKAAMKLDIDICAPSHGPVNNSDPKKFIGKYLEWTELKKPSEKPFVVVAYATSYGQTAKLAGKIADVLSAGGVDTKTIDVTKTSVGDQRDLLEAADAVLFGSPTFMHDVVRPMWETLLLLPTVACARKKAAAFGSYGWSGEAVDVMQAYLRNLKLKVYEPALKVRLIPSEADLAAAKEFAGGFLEFLRD